MFTGQLFCDGDRRICSRHGRARAKVSSQTDFQDGDYCLHTELHQTHALGVSLDLEDVYFQVQIHPNYREYLRFAFRGQVYQFRAMPFG
ncbi:hypothetical protein DPMN_136528 [Dreissena polymorpha]|uniref:Uncharacterized protein n=1 Tax=Dreissena polymorpha TaxID=45954 RepID=A0A9D4JHX2_DREPO|nr:hypothetical protein DPMN_136528 [Dreissena polymorpha]